MSLTSFPETSPARPPTVAVANPMESLLQEARLRLVETGTRNRLVHTPRGAKKSRALAFTGVDARLLFQSCVRDARTIQFRPREESGKQIARYEAGASGGLQNGDDGKLLRTLLEPETLQKRLLSLYRDARIAEEEQGINILFLAIGFLQWYEDDKSDVKREAPLVLVPVNLVRDKRHSTFELKVREQDIATNQAIKERLRADFDIALPEIPEHDEWIPADYLNEVREAVSSKARWSLEENSAELGFYSFSKLLMIRDLEPESWPDRSLLAHPLLRGLLAEGFADEAPLLADNARIDALFDPKHLVQVVDADSSQTLVIETVRAGRNLVVQGPPGTGKSQTITNIIAAAVHDGKTVLFVAEKMAALNVVHDRLRKTGLGNICLELHSRGATKRLIAEELDKTLSSNTVTQDASADISRLTQLRDHLNETASNLHAPVGDTGWSGFRALSEQIARDGQIVVADELLREATGWSEKAYADVGDATARLAQLTLVAGPLNAHAFFGVRATHLQPSDIARLMPQWQQLAAIAATLASHVQELGDFFAISGKPTLQTGRSLLAILQAIALLPATTGDIAARIAAADVKRVLETARCGIALDEMRAPFLAIFHDAAWDFPAGPMRIGLAAGVESYFAYFFGSAYRTASSSLAALLNGALPGAAADRLKLADALLAIQKLQADLRCEDATMSAALGAHWRAGKTDFKMLENVAGIVDRLLTLAPKSSIAHMIALAGDGKIAERIAYLNDQVMSCEALSKQVAKSLDIDLPAVFSCETIDLADLSHLARCAQGWIENRALFDQWALLAASDHQVRQLGAKTLADMIAKGTINASVAMQHLTLARAETVWRRAIAEQPRLRSFDGDQHEKSIAEFRSLDIKRRISAVAAVNAHHCAAMPRGAMGAMGVIRGEIGRKRGHMPIRKLMKSAGQTIQKIKPVFLMSPISVAQFLPPDSVRFDILVIDEASQIRPEDALGIVARAKQIVVVGDKKQLPPTSFFDRIMADEDDDDEDETGLQPLPLARAARATALESILSLCEARGLNSKMLRWHYRSRHPSLIEVSNAEFYQHLIMPPAPATERREQGLILHEVKGAYDRGGKRINVIEAEAVACAVAAHARNTPGLTLGIVAFSTVQRDAITDILEIKRRADPVLDGFLHESGAEDVFVKNIENVQGDERDVILISVGYGPRTAGGRLDSMAFGPVSSDGGERRLNVLFTRARTRCEIFVSFSFNDIVTQRSKGEGPRVLKRFLQFAETGVLEQPKSVSDDFDSPFEENVAAAVETLGYTVEKQIGSAGFKIDLAVRHPDQPGRFMLAIECDGATYHSALWARERDRLRQEILENLGWQFHRIWSTDWFYRRAAQIEALRKALDDACRDTPQKISTAPASAAPPVTDPAGAVPPPEFRSPSYELASFPVPDGLEPHEVPVSHAAKIVAAIVLREGPVHEDEIARRVAALFGKDRTGARIVEATKRALQIQKTQSGNIIREGQFWMTQDQADNTPVRSRALMHATLQRPDMVSPREIAAAIRIATEQNGLLSREDLPVAVARLLGFQRTGSDLKVAILAVHSQTTSVLQ